MNALQINTPKRRNFSFRQSVIEVINSKIQKTDSELTIFLANLQNSNQTPGQASEKTVAWIEQQKKIFEVIESASKIKSKLFYMRAKMTEYNSAKLLHLISSPRLYELSLQELKDEIS